MTGSDPAVPQPAACQLEPKFVLGMIAAEYKAAVASHPPMASAHEGYAVLLEELDELWAEIKQPEGRRNPWAMMREAVQVAAMAVRFIEDVCLKQLGAGTERNEIAPEQIRKEAAAHGLPGIDA
ncbi:MAG: hypothetical protein HPY55_16155 [Firmicutes bacterium]|nr:hypothetical protein [Bacillota bacterium]